MHGNEGMTQGRLGKGILINKQLITCHIMSSHVISIMAETHGSKASYPSRHQATISMYINWTKGLQSHHPKATSSTRRLHLYHHHQPSLSKHHGLHQHHQGPHGTTTNHHQQLGLQSSYCGHYKGHHQVSSIQLLLASRTIINLVLSSMTIYINNP